MWFSKKKALAATEECISEMMKEIEESDNLVKGFNEKLDKILEQQNSMAKDLELLKKVLSSNTEVFQEVVKLMRQT